MFTRDTGKACLIVLSVFVCVTEAEAKEAWEGKWAPSAAYCRNSPGESEQSPILISKNKFTGLENWCKVKKVIKQGGVVTLDRLCNGEGEQYSDQISFMFSGNSLQFIGDKTKYIKCK